MEGKENTNHGREVFGERLVGGVGNVNMAQKWHAPLPEGDRKRHGSVAANAGVPW